MLKKIVLLFAVFGLLFSTPVMAQTPTPTTSPPSTAPGSIAGTVVNKTAGTTSSISGLTLTLYSYQGSSQSGSKTAQSDSSGKFAFSGLSTDSTVTYQVVTVYQTATYYSDPLQFSAGESAKNLDLAVYDTTSSGAAVSVMLAHAILHYEKKTLSVKEYYLVSNTGDRAYIGEPLAANAGNLTTLNFTLPKGAANFQSIYGLDSYNLATGNQVYSGDPITPAGTEISYTYSLPVDSTEYTFQLTLNNKVARFDFLTSDSGMKISGSGISPQPPLNISGLTFQDYSLSNIAAGTTITAQLSNLGSSAPLATGGNNNYLYLLVLLVIPAAILAVIIFRRTRSAGPAPARANPQRDQLLTEIAQLDDDFEDGKIEEKVYRRLREEKMRQLTGGGG